MAEKTLSTRIVHKHDIEENWLKAVNFIPKQGEIIIYDIDDNYTYERMKIGDGAHGVNELPFSDEGVNAVINALQLDVNEEKNKLADVTTSVGTLSALVGDTAVSEQIDVAIDDALSTKADIKDVVLKVDLDGYTEVTADDIQLLFNS